MGWALTSSLIGLLLVILAVGIPYWLTHRHMRPQHDPGEVEAYQAATGKSGQDIAAGKPGRPIRRGGRAARGAARRWQAIQAEDPAIPAVGQSDRTE
jgi:hypothetical protein